MEGMFDSEDSELDVIQVLKEFFNPEFPETKTQIDSLEKIRILCEQKWFSLMLDTTNDLTVYQKREIIFNYYLVLLYSYQRQSREEVKESVKGLLQQPREEGNFLDKLGLK